MAHISISISTNIKHKFLRVSSHMMVALLQKKNLCLFVINPQSKASPTRLPPISAPSHLPQPYSASVPAIALIGAAASLHPLPKSILLPAAGTKSIIVPWATVHGIRPGVASRLLGHPGSLVCRRHLSVWISGESPPCSLSHIYAMRVSL